MIIFAGEVTKELLEETKMAMREWTMQAARGECGWICSSCCASDARGMPDECMGGDEWCTGIIQRDKKAAHDKELEQEWMNR